MIKITLTGLDEKTDILKLNELGKQLGSLVEFGILYTATPEDRNRYPHRSWIAEVVQELNGQCALHVCGRVAREQLMRRDLHDIVPHVKRVQVNGVLTYDEVIACASPNYTLITQHCIGNQSLLGIQGIDHALLVDASGGRGILPAEWERPPTSKAVGFAGGLGPKTLAAQWPFISDVASGDYWVDMEGKLRTEDDWFSVDMAAETMNIFHDMVHANGEV